MQFLIIHMHGLGDMLMFVPTFNLLQQKKDYVDLIVFENNSISPIKNSSKIEIFIIVIQIILDSF